MRKNILAGAIVALSLTGCATGPSDYERYAKTQENIALARAEADIAKYKALETIALKGDSSASVAAAMGIVMGGNTGTGPRDMQMAQPKSTADKLLPWASLLVPSLTQFYSITKNADIAITNSNNNLEGKKSDNGMVVDLVQGRSTPIVGNRTDSNGSTEDFLLYPQ